MNDVDITPMAHAIRRLLLRNFHPLAGKHYWLGSPGGILIRLRRDDECADWEHLPKGCPRQLSTRNQMRDLLGDGEQLRRFGISYRPQYSIYFEFIEELQEALS